MPNSQLVAISKARGKKPKEGEQPANASYSYRFDSHSDVWLRKAHRMTMNFDKGTIKSALKHCDRALLGQIASFVRPLQHTLNMPLSYVIFIMSISVIGSMILMFSVLTFYRRIFMKCK